MSPTERLAQHRIEMQRAIADRVSLAEARKRLAYDRWLASQALLAAKREAASLPRAFEPVERPQPWMMRD
ncbi:MAG: hypothetical protein P0Y59_02745 [Candidatus Sphingomonas phytovorans]|nr:hypothetical protein [Sphingomonas sp.]WEK00630.1 MAG: hypothetical protein P0Y59_02745 [Sphingomonas sp.]